MDADAALWIRQCAERLRVRWRTLDAGVLEEAAAQLREDERLREMDPKEAAEVWLRPIGCDPVSHLQETLR